MRWFYKFSCLALVACATPSATPSPTPPPDVPMASFSKVPGDSFNGTSGALQVSNRYVTGPNTKLYVGDGAIRGSLKFNIPVQVTIQGEHAEGTLGDGPFNCIAHRNPDGSAHVTAGTTTYRNTDFEISPTQINGRINGVTYNMTWTGERYEDRATPGGFTKFSIPEAMAAWTDTEIACVLALLAS